MVLGWDCISPLLLLGVCVAAVVVASCFFETHFLSNEAKCFPLVVLNAFLLFNGRFWNGGCVRI